MKRIMKRTLALFLTLLLLGAAAPLASVLAVSETMSDSNGEDLLFKNAVEYKGHYYQAIVDYSISWHDAKVVCEKNGGHLATISDEDENMFVFNLVESTGVQCWLGATDEVEEGVWVWVTGEPWQYCNASFDNRSNQQHYLVMSYFENGIWDDQSEKGNSFLCKANGYVCEWDGKSIGSYSQGAIIKFGSYPQTEVKDSTLIAALNAASANKDWISYGYYSGTGTWNDGKMTLSDYMRYVDITLDSIKYRGVKFTNYRPYYTGCTSSAFKSYQDDNGYYINMTYWFRYEPLQWRVLDPMTGLVLCERIVDSQPFNNYVLCSGTDVYGNDAWWGDALKTLYSNNYYESSIRCWLNEAFLKIAFDEAHRTQIQLVARENEAYYAGRSAYDSASSTDMVSLLSYSDIMNTAYYFSSGQGVYDISSRASGTDYAMCQGLYADSRYVDEREKNSSNFWLRSAGDFSYLASSAWSFGEPYFGFVNNTSLGVRPAMNLDPGFVPGSIENEEPAEESKLRVIVNNTDLSYYVGDTVLLCVSDVKGDVESYPNALSVKVSDANILSVIGYYDYADFPEIYGKADELQHCKIIAMKTNASGRAYVSLTNSETGANRVIPIHVCENSCAATLRADQVTEYEYIAGPEHDLYNAYTDGIWVADFSYTSVSGGWNYSMNLYNENYCCGVVEVYDANGKLREVRNIDKFESLTKGIFKSINALYTVVEDAFEGDILSFRDDSTAKCTPIKDLFVPQEGYIRITADISVSVSCAISNAIDVIFTGWAMADNIKDLVSGMDDLSEDQIKEIKMAAFAKTLAQEEYLELGEKFQKKLIKKSFQPASLNTINLFVSGVTLDFEDLLNEMGWSMEGLLKTALKTGVSIAEDLFEKCAGPAGFVLKTIFALQDTRDYLQELKDINNRITGDTKFGCATPLIAYHGGVLKGEKVSVKTNGSVPDETVLETYRIMQGDNYLIEVGTGRLLNEYTLYEIALVNNGKKVQPTGKVEVSIESPYERAVVARQCDDGSWELIDSRMKNGMVVFEVDHFCRFVVFEEEKTDARIDGVTVSSCTVLYKKTALLTLMVNADTDVKYTVVYTSANPKVATVDTTGKITANKRGTTMVTVTVTDESGNSVQDTCTVTVKYAWWQVLIRVFLFGFLWY